MSCVCQIEIEYKYAIMGSNVWLKWQTNYALTSAFVDIISQNYEVDSYMI